MKIGLDLIYECLEQNFKIIEKKLKNCGQDYKFPVLYSQQPTISGTVYVADAKALSLELLNRQDILLICVGKNEDPTTIKCQYIMIDDSQDTLTVYSVLTDLFCQINDWKEQIYELCMNNRNLQDILDVSASIFSKNLLYLNNRFEVLAYSLPGGKLKDSDEEYMEWLAGKNKENLKALPMNMNDVNNVTTQKTPYVFHYSSDVENLNYLCATVKELNRGVGYVALDIGNDYATGTQLWLIEFLRKSLERFFRNFLLADQNHQLNIQGVFYSILDGIQLDRTMIEKNLEKFGSPAYETYLCIVIALNSANKLGIPVIYLCSQIEQTLGRAFTVQYDTQIVVLVNLTQSDLILDKSLSEFENLLRNNHLKAGVSNEFCDIFNAKLYYKQARKAFETGSTSRPNQSIYHFKDFAVQYVLRHYADELPVEMICAEGVIRLLEYEKESNVEYCKTLSTYLRNNMNAIQTAKTLYIHRSTMLFRLNRIKEILKMDFNNPDDRLYLEISLKLLGKDEY